MTYLLISRFDKYLDRHTLALCAGHLEMVKQTAPVGRTRKVVEDAYGHDCDVCLVNPGTPLLRLSTWLPRKTGTKTVVVRWRRIELSTYDRAFRRAVVQFVEPTRS